MKGFNEAMKYLKENNDNIRIITENEILCEMANLTTNKTGLQVDIWSDHKGKKRNRKDKSARVKIGTNDYEVSVSIEENPKILAQTKNIKRNDMLKIKKAMKYIGRNYDLFLKHYNDTDNSFDDEDLFNALRERGEYK